MATFTHPITGEVREYIPYAELTDEQRTWADSGDHVMRQTAAERGWGLDVLVADKFRNVRRAVAAQGFGLDALVADESKYVRAAVAEQGFGLDALLGDENGMVRAAVARQGYELGRLVRDKGWSVRKAVAEQGYGLDRLNKDSYQAVRDAVTAYLEAAGLTLEQWAARNPDKCAKKRKSGTSLLKGAKAAQKKRGKADPKASIKIK